MKKENKEANKPVAEFRAGGVKATIWKTVREGKNGKFDSYNTTIQRSFYKDKEGEWQQTNSYGINDLQRLDVVLQETVKYLLLNDDAVEEQE